MNTSTQNITTLILNTIPEAVAWKNTHSEYAGCNTQFAKMAGYQTEDEIIGKKNLDLSWIDTSRGRGYADIEKQVLSTEKPILNMIEFHYHENGADVWLDTSFLPIIDDKNNMMGVLQIFRDITTEMEIKQNLHNATAHLEQQVKERTHALNLAKQEAVDSNREKSQFLSNMSHELRTPLNAILGFTQLLQMENEQSQSSRPEDIEEILKAGKHLLQLINEVLDLAKIEAGHISLSMESVNVETVLNECFELSSSLATQYNIKLIKLPEAHLSKPSEQTTVFVSADHLRLKQVLLNLLSNAIKYNKNAGSVSVTYSEIERNITRITVTDTGRGIDLQQQSKLFTAFERLGVESEEIEGTGIGLVLAKRIIEEMHGRIKFKSQLGVGSEFWIELPSAPAVSTKVNKTAETWSLSDQEPPQTVLYIEDNPANLRMLTAVFKHWPQWQLLTANEPLSGLQLATNHQPDLILLDLNLPFMDGYAVFEQLKKSDLTKHIPVIAISANAMSTDLKKGKRAGFTDYITKPIDIDVLSKSIKKVF